MSYAHETETENQLAAIEDILNSHPPGILITQKLVEGYASRPQSLVFQSLTYMPGIDKKTDAEKDVYFRIQLLGLRTQLIKSRSSQISSRDNNGNIGVHLVVAWLLTVLFTPVIVYFVNLLCKKYLPTTAN